MNLDAFQRNQAFSRRKNAEERIIALLPEAYSWLLVPEQSDPRKPDYIQEYKLQPQQGQSLLASIASSLLRTEELLITRLAGLRLRQELERIPLWRGDHVSTKELVENFARYIYLPRLKHPDVLLEAMREGVKSSSWRNDTFAYADGWDEERQRYRNLRAGEVITVIIDGQSLLVKADVAEVQLAAEQAEAEAKRQALAGIVYTPRSQSPAVYEPEVGMDNGAGNTGPVQQPPILALVTKQAQRYNGSVQINARMMGSEAGKIMEEVVKHLTSLAGAKVKVTLEIEAELAEGAPEYVERTVKENSNTLHFQISEFHEQ